MNGEMGESGFAGVDRMGRKAGFFGKQSEDLAREQVVIDNKKDAWHSKQRYQSRRRRDEVK